MANSAERWQITEKLGSGGFSQVYKARWAERGMEVAIKKVQKRGGTDAEAMIEEEVRIMKMVNRLGHPHLIQLYDSFDDGVSINIVMELCQGGELFDRIIQRGRYSEKDAAAVISQIASAIDALHSQNILHCDLKPENVLYHSPEVDSQLKVMDFGLSTHPGRTRALRGLFGSLDYIAPEALGKREFLKAGDMWSVGVILYILLSGYPPFYHENTTHKHILVLRAQYDFNDPVWATVTESAKSLVQSLLTKDPAARLTAADVVVHPWVRGQTASREPMHPDALKNLRIFNAKRKFRAAGFACLAGSALRAVKSQLSAIVPDVSMSPEELDELREQFNSVSANQSVTKEQFIQVLERLHWHQLLAVANRIFELFDSDKNGQLDFREFVIGMSAIRSGPHTRHSEKKFLKFCFKVYDSDSSGTISKEEMVSMLSILVREDQAIDETENERSDKLGDIFEKMDIDKDGQISYAEFEQAVFEDDFLSSLLLNPLRVQP